MSLDVNLLLKQSRIDGTTPKNFKQIVSKVVGHNPKNILGYFEDYVTSEGLDLKVLPASIKEIIIASSNGMFVEYYVAKGIGMFVVDGKCHCFIPSCVIEKYVMSAEKDPFSKSQVFFKNIGTAIVPVGEHVSNLFSNEIRSAKRCGGVLQ